MGVARDNSRAVLHRAEGKKKHVLNTCPWQATRSKQRYWRGDLIEKWRALPDTLRGRQAVRENSV